jgi:hypothetical protein
MNGPFETMSDPNGAVHDIADAVDVLHSTEY